MSAAVVMGEFVYVGPITPLQIQVQFMLLCPKCEMEEIFVAAWACESGLLGCCLGCKQERIAPFSRVNGEAA